MAYSNILITVDGSKYSDNAAKRGIELAKELSANITFLSVVDVKDVASNFEGEAINPEVFALYQKDAETVLNKILKKYPYKKSKSLTEEGLPTETILEVAKRKKMDLIIMGTHGRKGLMHLLMGSVAEYVVRHSKVPVMVIPLKMK
jgi:nucleotide-binding universal stress UspA family protein